VGGRILRPPPQENLAVATVGCGSRRLFLSMRYRRPNVAAPIKGQFSPQRPQSSQRC